MLLLQLELEGVEESELFLEVTHDLVEFKVVISLEILKRSLFAGEQSLNLMLCLHFVLLEEGHDVVQLVGLHTILLA